MLHQTSFADYLQQLPFCPQCLAEHDADWSDSTIQGEIINEVWNTTYISEAQIQAHDTLLWLTCKNQIKMSINSALFSFSPVQITSCAAEKY
jgi:hypothetical protein